jgi:DNA-binding NarL/FixJ family response regulator
MRILILEPDRLFAEGLQSVLAARGHDVVLGGLVIDLRAELAVIDADAFVVAPAPGAGVAALSVARQLAPGAEAVVVFEVHADPTELEEVIRHGARVAVDKSASLSELVSVIEGGAPRPATGRPRRFESATLKRLTARERETLEALVDGYSTEDLAGLLGVSTATARTHVQNVMMKLGVHSRVEAVATAVRTGIVDVEQDRAS